MITITILTLIFLTMSLIFKTLYAFTKVFIWILGILFGIIFFAGLLSATLVVCIPILFFIGLGIAIGIIASNNRTDV